jgi:hypothetical protein
MLQTSLHERSRSRGGRSTIAAATNIRVAIFSPTRRSAELFAREVLPALGAAAPELADIIGEPGWDRTNDLLIKSQLLYH